MRNVAIVFILSLVVTACGDTQTPTSAARSDDPDITGAVNAAAAVMADSGADLQPGQSVQGLIEADIGKGMQVFRSLSSKLDADLDQRVDQAMASRAGQQALDEANRSLQAAGIEQKAAAEQVRGLAAGMAGKTVHDSQVRHIAMVHRLEVGLNGAASDGARLGVNLSFDDNTLQLLHASIDVVPDSRQIMSRFQSVKETPPTVTIERFEKNADGTYAVAGHFSARDLQPARTARKLAGQTLPGVEGRFAFDALPFRELGIGR